MKKRSQRKKPYSQSHKYIVFINEQPVEKTFDKLSLAKKYICGMNVHGDSVEVSVVREKVTHTLVKALKLESKKVLTINEFEFDI